MSKYGSSEGEDFSENLKILPRKFGIIPEISRIFFPKLFRFFFSSFKIQAFFLNSRSSILKMYSIPANVPCFPILVKRIFFLENLKIFPQKLGIIPEISRFFSKLLRK